MQLMMVQELRSKLEQLERLFSRMRSLKNPNDLCKKVIPWRQEFKIFGKSVEMKRIRISYKPSTRMQTY
ncbi:hypothetical protein Pint_34401 [Pistacia integerrima]|uniref:Uncharacterized protein n=1 Tax=Pistacia integerrima TaxID=434235 RepID=A0ACC0X8S6_9ROSI|nr:hypothetical protein Pint_34401 [Pistacia integerrima]